MSNRVERIAVVGAGLAGLAAARALREAGLAAVVFEKARGAGGRSSTRRVAERAFDHGAQYFTCRDPRFAALLAPLREAGVVARWSGRVRTLARGRVGDADEATPRLVGVPGMSALARALSAGAEIVAECRVAAIAPAAHGWRLAADDGRALGEFDAAIVATPAPQAVPLLEAAPPLRDAVAAVRMRPCWALLAGFAEALPVAADGAFVSDSPLAWIARNNSKAARPSPEAWVLHASAAWSEAHLEDDADAVRDALLRAFGEALGGALPAPTYAAAHRWRFASTERALGQPYLWDAQARIGACGDWAEGGRVESAVLSGDGLARALCAARVR